MLLHHTTTPFFSFSDSDSVLGKQSKFTPPNYENVYSENPTCVFCKEFDVCILGCSIIFFDGDSNWVETNQSMCIASWLFGFYVVWDFPSGNFWIFCNI